jgi:hypothetical protein
VVRATFVLELAVSPYFQRQLSEGSAIYYIFAHHFEPILTTLDGLWRRLNVQAQVKKCFIGSDYATSPSTHVLMWDPMTASDATMYATRVVWPEWLPLHAIQGFDLTPTSQSRYVTDAPPAV